MLWFQFRLPQNFFRERYSKRFANFLQELLENDHKTIIFFYISHGPLLQRGSNISAYDLLNLLYELRKKRD